MSETSIDLNKISVDVYEITFPSNKKIPRYKRAFGITRGGYVLVSTHLVSGDALTCAMIDGAAITTRGKIVLVPSEWAIKEMPRGPDIAKLRAQIVAKHPDTKFVPEDADWRAIS